MLLSSGDRENIDFVAWKNIPFVYFYYPRPFSATLLLAVSCGDLVAIGPKSGDGVCSTSRKHEVEFLGTGGNLENTFSWETKEKLEI